MRESINIIDNDTIEVKGCKYTKDDTSLVFIIRCLTNDYDDLKAEYDRLVEQHQKVIKISNVEGTAYVITFFDLADRLGMNRQTLMQIASRAEFDRYRTYVTQPRFRLAFITTKRSLQLLYICLREKSKIKFSQQKFNELLKDVVHGESC